MRNNLSSSFPSLRSTARAARRRWRRLVRDHERRLPGGGVSRGLCNASASCNARRVRAHVRATMPSRHRCDQGSRHPDRTGGSCLRSTQDLPEFLQGGSSLRAMPRARRRRYAGLPASDRGLGSYGVSSAAARRRGHGGGRCRVHSSGLDRHGAGGGPPRV